MRKTVHYRHMAERPNLVLICFDSVRKDIFDKVATSLVGLSDIKYEQCRAASSWSVPSHASMFTGQLPHEHGVHTHNLDFTRLTVEDFLTARLKGYTSINVTANVWLTNQFGFGQFFDKKVNISPQQYFDKGLNTKKFETEIDQTGLSKYLRFIHAAIEHEYPLHSLCNGLFNKAIGYFRHAPVPTPFDDGAKRVVNASLDQIESVTEPFFLFQNFMDAHGPAHHVLAYDRSLYDVPLSWTSQKLDFWEVMMEGDENVHNPNIDNYRELYRAAVDYLDRLTVEFIETVQEQTNRKTVFVITSDHGENLAYSSDDGLFQHSSTLSEGVLHVPLYVINPPETSGLTIDGFVSHLQLPELLTGIARGTLPDIRRKRIAAELIGGTLRIRQMAEKHGELDYWDRMQRCAFENGRKFHWDSLGNSRTLKLDQNRPSWQKEIDEDIKVPEWARALFDIEIATYQNSIDKDRDLNGFDANVRERLSDLGYL